MATITASATGGNWSATTAWVGGVVPTATDDVILTTGCGNITIDGTTAGTPSACQSLTCTGYTGTLTNAAGKQLNITNSLTFSSGMAYSVATTGVINFVGTSGSNTITTAGKTLGQVSFNGSGGTWTSQDNMIGTGSLTIAAGTYNAQNFNVTANLGCTVSGGTFNAGTGTLYFGVVSSGPMNHSAGTVNWTGANVTSFNLNSSGSTRTMNLGSSVWTLTGTGGSPIIINAPSLTLNAGTSKFILTGANTSSKTVTVTSGSATLYDIQFNGAAGATGIFNVAGAWTFHNITFQANANVAWTVGTSLYFNDMTSLGTAGNLVNFTSRTPGSRTSLVPTKAGNVVLDYMNIKDCGIYTAGSIPAYAGANSTDSGNNANWTFNGPPRVAATASTLGAATTISASTVLAQAYASKTMGSVVPSSATTVAIKATAIKTLGPVTSISAARVLIQAAASRVVGAVTGAASTLKYSYGTAIRTLGAFTGFSMVAVAIKAAASRTLGATQPTGRANLVIGANAVRSLSPFLSIANVITGPPPLPGSPGYDLDEFARVVRFNYIAGQSAYSAAHPQLNCNASDTVKLIIAVVDVNGARIDLSGATAVYKIGRKKDKVDFTMTQNSGITVLGNIVTVPFNVNQIVDIAGHQIEDLLLDELTLTVHGETLTIYSGEIMVQDDL